MANKENKRELIPQMSVRNVPAETMTKIQVIAGLEGINLSELCNLAFSRFIEAYESKNGKIKIQPKGKGLEGL